MWVRRATFEGLIGKVAYQKALLASQEDQFNFVSKLYEREKARADAAVDSLLIQKGLTPLTPATMTQPEADIFTEDPLEVEKMLKLIDRVGMTQALEESLNG